MKTIRILLLALLASAAFVCPRAQAQIGQITNPVSAPLYAQDAGTCSATANSNLIQQLPPNASTTTVNLSGTFSATVTVRASNNGGATWVTLGTASAAGTTTYGTNSYTHLCADVTTYTSGTVNVTISTGVVGGGNGNSGSASLPTTLTAPGVFTNTQMNPGLAVQLNSCNPTTIFQGAHPSQVATAPILSCISTPSSSVSSLWNIGIESQVVNNASFTANNPSVAFDAVAKAAVNGAEAWAYNAVAYTPSGLTSAASIFGGELDLVPQNTTDIAYGLSLISFATAQPTTFTALNISKFGTSNAWNTGLNFADAAINIGNSGGSSCGGACAPAIVFGASSSGNNKLSQLIRFVPTSSTGTDLSIDLVATVDGSNVDLAAFNSSQGLAGFQSSYLKPKTFTVSTLPSGMAAGEWVQVSDATSFTPGTCTGGGSDFMIAIFNGSTWSCH